MGLFDGVREVSMEVDETEDKTETEAYFDEPEVETISKGKKNMIDNLRDIIKLQGSKIHDLKDLLFFLYDLLGEWTENDVIMEEININKEEINKIKKIRQLKEDNKNV